jgi:N-acetylneuraminic acid mutarotase
MSQKITSVFILICLSIAGVATVDSGRADDAADSWVKMAPMNEARSGLGVAAVDGKIYAIGGSTASGLLTSSPPQAIITSPGFVDGFVGTNEEYDPSTDTWTYKASMPTARISFATAVYQNKIYCIGGRISNGYTTSYTTVNEVYDPATNTWETKTSMPSAKGWITANVVGDKIYVVGGGVYDPVTDSWTPNESIAQYNGYVSASLDKKIFIVGGSSPDNYYNLNLIYDTETDSFSSGSYPPSSVAAGTAVALDDKVFVLGCPQSLRQYEPDNFVRIYDPKNDSWALGASLERNYLFNFGAANIDDELYVVGGLNYNMLQYWPENATQKYTPAFPSEPSPTQMSPQETESGISPLLIILPFVLLVVIGVGLLLFFKKVKIK